MIIVIKLLDIALTAYFKYIAETKIRLFQIIGIPVITVSSMLLVGLLDNNLDWFVLISLLAWIPLDLGYKDYGPDDQIARAAWLATISLALWITPTIKGHLDIIFSYSGYIILLASVALAGACGRWFRKWDNKIGAPLNGLALSIPVIFYH